jgi:hypothetical protein
MNRDDFMTVWKMLIGVWPRLDTDETIAAWWGLLAQYPAHHAQSSVRRWSVERRSAPTPSDIIAGIKMILDEQRREQRRVAIPGRMCDECEGTGFVWLDFAGHGTVKRCRRGCMPPEQQRQDEEPATDNRAWAARFRETRQRLAQERSSMNEHEYLRHRGFDPAYYRISHGTIIARIPEQTVR